MFFWVVPCYPSTFYIPYIELLPHHGARPPEAPEPARIIVAGEFQTSNRSRERSMTGNGY